MEKVTGHCSSEVSRNRVGVSPRPSLVVEESGAANVSTRLGRLSTEHAGLGVAQRAGRRLQSSAERRIRPASGRGRPRWTPSARCALAKEQKEGLRPGWFLFVPKIKGGWKGRMWGQGKKAQGAARAGSPAGARGWRAEPIGTGPSRRAPPPPASARAAVDARDGRGHGADTAPQHGRPAAHVGTSPSARPLAAGLARWASPPTGRALGVWHSS